MMFLIRMKLQNVYEVVTYVQRNWIIPGICINRISKYITVVAIWRTLGNQTYPSPDPSVFEVKVKTPEDVELLLQKEKASDFIIYLNRRRTDVQLKYPEFFKKYAWSYKKPAKYNDLTCYTIQIPRIAKPIYISQRDSNRRCITRIGMLHPTAAGRNLVWEALRNFLIHSTSSVDKKPRYSGTDYSGTT